MAPKKEQFHIFELPNGLRLVSSQAASDVDYFGVTVNAGARDEASDRFGLAHFVEHTIFKGTLHRRACHINQRMESVGGELNAFTTKEETTVYTISPCGNLSRAVELVADLLENSQFPDGELDKEREVVADEIDSYLDQPSEAVFDDFEDMIFRGSQLGHNILGTNEALAGFSSQVCRGFITDHYTAPRMVAFYRGRLAPARVEALVRRYFSDFRSHSPAVDRVTPTVNEPEHIVRSISSHQAHCVIGARVGSLHSADRTALGLVCNILGGPGMNSRLNVELREKRGLVYSVESSLNLMSDCGLMTVYFGCDPDDSSRCVEIVSRQLHEIATHLLTARQLQAAKQQYLGQLVVASDNNEQMALNSARSILHYGRVAPSSEVRDRILALTADDLLAAAAQIVPSRCSRLTLSQ